MPVPPSALLIAGELDPEGLVEAANRARERGVEQVYVRTDDGAVARAAESHGVEPLPPGREAVADAAARISERVRDGDLSPDDVNESTVKRETGTPEIEAVLVVGESRLADAALLGTAYAEYFYADSPDPGAVDDAIDEFEERSRRFGR